MAVSMRAIAIFWWPGLPGLWLRGQWSGLWQAVAFAVLLNLVLIATLISPTFAPAWSILFVWGGLIIAWALCVVQGYFRFREFGESAVDDDPGLFLRAQSEYLHGHWHEAESLLQQQLRRFGGDVDARLMLATLYRHTRRTAEADQQLQVVQRTDGAEKWQWEIEQERRMLKRLSAVDRENTQPTSSC